MEYLRCVRHIHAKMIIVHSIKNTIPKPIHTLWSNSLSINASVIKKMLTANAINTNMSNTMPANDTILSTIALASRETNSF